MMPFRSRLNEVETMPSSNSISEISNFCSNPDILMWPSKLLIFSSNFCCPVSGFALEEIEPRIFSFNSPQGACKDCDGLGDNNFFDPDLLVPNKELSISEGAIKLWEKGINKYYSRILDQLNYQINLPLDLPFNKIKKNIIDILFYGSENILIEEVLCL